MLGQRVKLSMGIIAQRAQCWYVELKVKVAFWVAASCEETRVHNTCTAYTQRA